MHIRPFSAIFPNKDYISSADSFFESVKFEYPEYVLSGFFNERKPTGMYIYQIDTKRHAFVGLTCCVDVEDYIQGKIKKHENTLPASEQLHVQLLLRRKTAVKPLVLIYRNVDALDKWLQGYIEKGNPEFEMEFDDPPEVHRFWAIRKEEDIEFLQNIFLDIPQTYIADGHHRIAATKLLYERAKNNPNKHKHDKTLCTFFPVSELECHDYNRVVHNLETISMAKFMALLSQVFDIEPMDQGGKPTQKHELTMYLRKEWFRLRWRRHVLAEYKDQRVILDTMLLNEKVLKGILKMEDIRNDERVEYVEGPKGLEPITAKVNRDDHSVGFCLHPLILEELILIADEDKVLPPKSTWFEPRLKNGLIVKEYYDKSKVVSKI